MATVLGPVDLGRVFVLFSLPQCLDFKLFGSTILVISKQVWTLSDKSTREVSFVL